MEDAVTGFPELSLWKPIWQLNIIRITGFAAFLILIVLMMVFQERLARRKRLLAALRYAIPAVSLVYGGLVLKAQPTTTNIIIIVNSLRELQFPLGLYLLEPYIFLSFVFILLTLLVWGRGVFCGWVCPYGAMLELLNNLREKVFPKFRLVLPEKIHWKLVSLKYIVFAAITGVSLYSFVLSEYLTEVEPFRTFVLKLDREWYYVGYFLILTAGSMMVYRAFCRYLCPLGAALAIPSFFRWLPLTKLRRHDLCGTCALCGKGACAYQSITPDGRIAASECLHCMECQVNFWDEDRCPGLKRKLEKRAASAASARGPGRARGGALFLLAVSASAALSLPAEARAARIVVGVDYPTIGEAIKRAKSGDVIEVRAGEYREMLRIDKALHLQGINNPTLIGQKGYIIEIASRGVTVEGFTIRNAGSAADADMNSAGIYIKKGADNAVVKNNRLFGVMHGVWSVGAKGVRVENNAIEGRKELDRNFRGNGIYLTDSQEALVAGNRVDYCRDGLYVEVSHDGRFEDNDVRNSRYAIHTMWVDRSVFSRNTALGNLVGIAVMYSKESKITGNVSAGNQTNGLLVIQTVKSEISGNTVIGNTKGIYFYNSVLNRLSSNLIMNNGLGLHNWGGSEDNAVTGNSFISNEVQVKFVAGRDQEWDGNHWSDYLGWDMNADGVGDLPYESNTVVDHILWRYPSAKLLYASPSFQILWMLEKQFPVFTVPKVLDKRPSMTALHGDWKELKARYPYDPEKYYGEMEKAPAAH